MNAVISNMLWLPTDRVPVRKLLTELSINTKAFKGSGERVDMYDVVSDGDTIGVPRIWGLDKLRWLLGEGAVVEDRTVKPLMSWPKIKFPEGGGYWKGQEKSVQVIAQELLTGKYGALLEAPCGSGKTLMGLDIASRLETPTLIVVHKGDLSDQWHKTAPLFPGLTIGHVQGDRWDWEGKHIVTAMAQTLFNQRNELPIDFLQRFGLVIYDEGHRYPARTFEKVMRLFPARYRLGVSATWRRNDGMECVWHWHCGHVEWRMQCDRLTGEYVQVPWTTKLVDGMFRVGGSIQISKWINAIAENAPYNVWLVDKICKGAGAGRRVLVVSDRVEHLRHIRARLYEKGLGITVGLYVGAIDGRRVTKPDLEQAKACDVILATYGMMAEGTDIPALDTLFFATPRADVEQVIGRIQRQGEKKRLLVVDPTFQTPYNVRLAKKREIVYDKLKFTKQGV